MRDLFLKGLNGLDRRAIVLIVQYEQCRKSAGQFGYSVFREWDASVIQSPIFKQFQTVTEWIAKHGWQVGWKTEHWQGYLKFVFTSLKPTIPNPGQLKNEKLLKEYLLSASNVVPEIKSDEVLRGLYLRVLRPEITRAPAVMRALGL
jgi:hypothetical protein